jgi:hypothetical protein
MMDNFSWDAFNKCHDDEINEINQLRADNERLRKALEETYSWFKLAHNQPVTGQMVGMEVYVAKISGFSLGKIQDALAGEPHD